MSENDVLILASAIAGSILLLWNNKRKFSRLNRMGVERFKNFRQKIGATLLDTVLLGCGLGFLGAAGIGVLVEYAQPFLSVLVFLGFIWVVQEVFSKSKK